MPNSGLVIQAFAEPLGGHIFRLLANRTFGYFNGTPTASISGYDKGAIAIDYTNALVYYNSGTATVAVWTQLNAGVALGGLLATAAELNRVAKLSTRSVVLATGGSDSTTTITPAVHSDKDVVIDNATKAATINLPSASGSGAHYNFYIGTSITNGAGNSITFVAGTAGDFFGKAWVVSDNSAAVLGYVAAGSTSINFDGTTKGGIKGDWVECRDVALGKMMVRVMTNATGTEATPFG